MVDTSVLHVFNESFDDKPWDVSFLLSIDPSFFPRYYHYNVGYIGLAPSMEKMDP